MEGFKKHDAILLKSVRLNIDRSWQSLSPDNVSLHRLNAFFDIYVSSECDLWYMYVIA